MQISEDPGTVVLGDDPSYEVHIFVLLCQEPSNDGAKRKLNLLQLTRGYSILHATHSRHPSKGLPSSQFPNEPDLADLTAEVVLPPEPRRTVSVSDKRGHLYYAKSPVFQRHQRQLRRAIQPGSQLEAIVAQFPVVPYDCSLVAHQGRDRRLEPCNCLLIPLALALQLHHPSL